MAVRIRPYRHPEDYQRIGDFLTATCAKRSPHHNWLQPRWEYMHYHPLIRERSLELGRCGVWHDGRRIAGAVHFEHRMGVVYLQIDPSHSRLRFEMLSYAERNLVGTFAEGLAIYVYVEDTDTELQAFAQARGYEPIVKWVEPMRSWQIPDPFPEISVAKPYRLQSLADEFDLVKIHRVMHRGFGHEGEPLDEELGARARKLSAPNFRRDLTIVAAAPDGSYASFCGIWLDSVNRHCYVEPVATDPDHRQRGLGKAVVLEAIRRCGAEGAEVAYVGSDLPLYASIGFTPVYRQTPWRKRL